MRYVSTRGGMEAASFQEILIAGLAPDGGLAVPEFYPRVSAEELSAWRQLDYCGVAMKVLSMFADDMPAADLKSIIQKSYTASAFGTGEITPVLQLDEHLYLLRLSFGPTLAFKDVAMQLLGNLFEYVLVDRGQDINILGATSGDTGSSAEHAMRGKSRIRVFMLSPDGAMSPFQRAQMYSIHDANIFNVAIRGVFDDCQDVVKTVAEDAEFKSRCRIGAVNSINWARIAAQVVYYFKAYLAVTKNPGEEVSFSVPSGNFGNVLAGHIASRMGLPIRQLIVATNENDVLEEFFRTGIYSPRGSQHVYRTSSPSMDISKASNFERFVYDLVDRDPERLGRLWSELARKGSFDLSAEPAFAKAGEFGFRAGRSSHADRIETIRRIRADYQLTVDPHTADGLKVGCELRDPGVPLICMETALPAKFEETIHEALGETPERPPGFTDLEERPQRFDVMDVDAGALKHYIAARAGTR